jgi:hypothetical protein
MLLFFIVVVIGIGTIIGLLKEQLNQNKRIIKLLEEIKE